MATVLQDHNQKGRQFIPPFVSQFGKNFIPVSWDNDTIPEIIWVSFINAELGVQDGAEFFIEVCANIALPENIASHSMAMISNYELLGLEEKEKTLFNLDNKKLLKPLQRILNDFLVTYPMCPLNFFIPEPNRKPRKDCFTEGLKTTLAALYKRNSEISIFSAANVIYNQFVNGHMVVTPTTTLAKFPEIRHYPKTEESKMVASAILSAIKVLHNAEVFNVGSGWKKYFWDTTFKLEPCKI